MVFAGEFQAVSRRSAGPPAQSPVGHAARLDRSRRRPHRSHSTSTGTLPHRLLDLAPDHVDGDEFDRIHDLDHDDARVLGRVQGGKKGLPARAAIVDVAEQVPDE